MNRPLAPTLTILVASLALACSGKDGNESQPKAEQKADAKAEQKAEAKPATEEAPKAAPERVEAPSGKVFRKNQPAMPGMTPEEVEAYAEALRQRAKAPPPIDRPRPQ